MADSTTELKQLLLCYINEYEDTDRLREVLQTTSVEDRYEALMSVRGGFFQLTAVHNGAIEKDVDSIKCMMAGFTSDQQYNVLSVPNSFKITALHYTAYYNSDTAIVMYLLSNLSVQQKYNLLRMQDNAASTALHDAATTKHNSVLQVMLSSVSPDQQILLQDIENNKNKTFADITALPECPYDVAAWIRLDLDNTNVELNNTKEELNNTKEKRDGAEEELTELKESHKSAVARQDADVTCTNMNLTLEVKDYIIDMLNNYKNDDYMSENYRLVTKEPIGTGGFGEVFEVIAKQPSQSQHRLAMKKIEICFEENYSDEGVSLTSDSDGDNILEFVQCCQEAVLQSKVFDHPGIVKVYDKWIQKPSAHSKDPNSQTYAKDVLIIAKFLQSGGQEAGVNVIEITAEVRQALVRTEGLCVYLIMDFYDSSLQSWISTRREPQTKEEIIVQLIQALHYIHSEKGYCHLDLSSGNILVKKGENEIAVAIGDFGLSMLYESSVPQRNDTRPGKPPYNLAPDEYLTYSYDMWSFGFIVYELLCKEAPSATELDKLYQRVRKESSSLAEFLADAFKEVRNPTIKSIVEKCLQLTGRITARELLIDLGLQDEGSESSVGAKIAQPMLNRNISRTQSVLSIVSSKSSVFSTTEIVRYSSMVNMDFQSCNVVAQGPAEDNVLTADSKHQRWRKLQRLRRSSF